MHHRVLRAVIYLRSMDDHERCRAYCAARGYRLVGLVHDPDGTRWPSVIDALLSGQYDVIVRRPDLDPQRVPRVEFVYAEDPPVGEVKPRRRRPRSSA